MSSLSAFGIDHGEIYKARNRAGVTRGRMDPATSMTHRGGEGYFHPSTEQVAAAKARRAGQKQASAHYQSNVKPKIRSGGGKIVPFAEHWRAAGKMPHVTAGILAAGGGAAYLLHRRTPQQQMAKALTPEDRRKTENVGLGAAAGTAAGVGTMNLGGHAVKATLKQRRATRGTSPYEEKVWSEHKKKYPSTSGGNRWKSYARYPKELPDWKLHRGLAFKNRPAVSTGLVLAHTAAGAAYGLHRNKKSQVVKSIQVPQVGRVRFRSKNLPGMKQVVARAKGGKKLGELQTVHEPGTEDHGTVWGIEVGEKHQRKGIGTGMLRHLEGRGVKVKHSELRTNAGDAWAKKVGGHLPKRWPEEVHSSWSHG
jgi:ribosomal protein S18 acetylase RimI-like enzyme